MYMYLRMWGKVSSLLKVQVTDGSVSCRGLLWVQLAMGWLHSVCVGQCSAMNAVDVRFKNHTVYPARKNNNNKSTQKQKAQQF